MDGKSGFRVIIIRPVFRTALHPALRPALSSFILPPSRFLIY